MSIYKICNIIGFITSVVVGPFLVIYCNYERNRVIGGEMEAYLRFSLIPGFIILSFVVGYVLIELARLAMAYIDDKKYSCISCKYLPYSDSGNDKGRYNIFCRACILLFLAVLSFFGWPIIGIYLIVLGFLKCTRSITRLGKKVKLLKTVAHDHPDSVEKKEYGWIKYM